MDGLALLAEAINAGLAVTADGDRIMIRGPKSAEATVRKLIENKAIVLPLVRNAEAGVESTHAGHSARSLTPTPPEPLRPAPAPPPVHHALRRQSSPAEAVTRPAAIADWAMLLTVDDLPPAPFQFGGPWCKIVDPEKFLRALKCDIRRGPTGPRAQGALQSDLATLRALLVGNAGSANRSANIPQATAA